MCIRDRLNSINPEILNERLAKIEERLYVVKEMLTTEEAVSYTHLPTRDYG